MSTQQNQAAAQFAFALDPAISAEFLEKKRAAIAQRVRQMPIHAPQDTRLHSRTSQEYSRVQRQAFFALRFAARMIRALGHQTSLTPPCGKFPLARDEYPFHERGATRL